MKKDYVIAPSWRTFLSHDHGNLRFCTIIIGAIRVSESDLLSSKSCDLIGSEVLTMIYGFKSQWLSLTRGRSVTDLLWRGEFELELFHDVPLESHRTDLLNSLGYDTTPLAPYERWLVVHVHFVCALPTSTDDRLRNAIAGMWRAKWQTNVKKLYQNQTIEEAVTNLCNYCRKRKLEYSSGGLADEPVKFVASYGLLWGRFINTVYAHLDTEFRSKR